MAYMLGLRDVPKYGNASLESVPGTNDEVAVTGISGALEFLRE